MNGQVPRILAPSPTFYIAKTRDKRRPGSGAPSSGSCQLRGVPDSWSHAPRRTIYIFYSFPTATTTPLFLSWPRPGPPVHSSLEVEGTCRGNSQGSRNTNRDTMLRAHASWNAGRKERPFVQHRTSHPAAARVSCLPVLGDGVPGPTWGLP